MWERSPLPRLITLMDVSLSDSEGCDVMGRDGFLEIDLKFSFRAFVSSDTCTYTHTPTAAGIPDFRSPDTGLYANLQKYNLPHPQAIFEIGYFRQNPKPFYMLARELYPTNFKVFPIHTACTFSSSLPLLNNIEYYPIS